MTPERYMELLEQQNPAIFQAHKIRITTASFRAQIERAFVVGREQGVRDAELEFKNAPNPLMDLLHGFKK